LYADRHRGIGYCAVELIDSVVEDLNVPDDFTLTAAELLVEGIVNLHSNIVNSFYVQLYMLLAIDNTDKMLSAFKYVSTRLVNSI